MELEQTIRERRSIRKFNPAPVARDKIVELMREAERLCVRDEEEPQRRYLYAGTPDARKRLADYLTEKIEDNKVAKLALGKLIGTFHKRFMEPAANIIVIAKKGKNPAEGARNYGTACRIMQSFQLLAWREKIGMVWITEPFVLNERFFDRIGLRADERFVGLLQIGHFDKAPRGRGRTPAERYWNVLSAPGAEVLPANESETGARSEQIRYKDRPVPADLVLKLLNHAVWAPNHRMREPWRFTYAERGAHGRAEQAANTAPPAHLIVSMRAETDEHKRDENLAAVYCLAQNFCLLAEERGLDAHVIFPNWMFDEAAARRLKIPDKEQIVAVLELGFRGEVRSAAAEPPPGSDKAETLRWSEL
ncbi:nitroreductase family protein [Saccharibacillus sp. CPCC 101409]|uniref:nitroreductase family protein n=1 Tax=Saccharibacillus sp. CPCC 101409 TaxID=3058041 RepID=UPI0026733377|nr:nitroreductase family protein [Saccharibacillus sp. CPCC 101409]MDO3410393.1 nitroreductase family protein [Saccharibacillus sp. CPCC 101409]